jgi:hypothetical protein
MLQPSVRLIQMLQALYLVQIEPAILRMPPVFGRVR